MAFDPPGAADGEVHHEMAHQRKIHLFIQSDENYPLLVSCSIDDMFTQQTWIAYLLES